jgi:hypothetical protein
VFRLQEHFLLLEGVSSAGACNCLLPLQSTLIVFNAQIWPTHKWLCGKDSSTFSFAPFSPAERSQLIDIAAPARPDPKSVKNASVLLGQLKEAGLFDGSWEVSLFFFFAYRSHPSYLDEQELLDLLTCKSPSLPLWQTNSINAWVRDFVVELTLDSNPW